MEAAAQNLNPNTSRLQAFFEFFLIPLVVAGVIGAASSWGTIQLTQNSQASEIRQQGEKIGRLEKESVPRELFDERTKTILEKLERQGEMIEKIRDRK